MWLVNFVQGKSLLLEKTCWVTVGGRNLEEFQFSRPPHSTTFFKKRDFDEPLNHFNHA
jgi:hypothetical protein